MKKIEDDENNQHEQEWKAIRNESLVLLLDELEIRYSINTELQRPVEVESKKENFPSKSIQHGKSNFDVSFLTEDIVVQPKKKNKLEEEIVRDEYDRYLKLLQNFETSDYENILDFHRKIKHQFPRITKLAFEILAIPWI